ncbi:hypothetical protein B8W95_13950, partial [Staphylococcus pasteuri]
PGTPFGLALSNVAEIDVCVRSVPPLQVSTRPVLPVVVTVQLGTGAKDSAPARPSRPPGRTGWTATTTAGSKR